MKPYNEIRTNPNDIADQILFWFCMCVGAVIVLYEMGWL